MVNIEDFQKLDIRIGKIISAERIPGSDKLLKLIFDVGEAEPRQILAGIAEHVEDPSSLVGKEMPLVLNLEPRKLRGEMSNGMILAASADERPILLHPAEEVPPGTTVR
ncbi:MAG: methionine--tRNA ligase subunit beta [Patescibacteria group bacterium]